MTTVKHHRALADRDVPEHSLTEIDPLLARLLAARGVTEPEQMDHRLKRLAPISLLGNVDQAAALLRRHRNDTITVVGDFDADGATSTALVMRCLRRLEFVDVRSLVPNRFDFGYGLSPEIVDVAAEDAPALIITVDNGISSHEGVARARTLGIDVLITDHHLAPPTLPAANVIVNPNLPGDPYPSKHLAGVGVAFCVMAALAREMADGDSAVARIPADYLDLVALGTVADVVPLDQNNRVLVEAGLARLRAGRGVAGIHALLDAAGRDASRLVATDLGFAVGPRLNAAGRLEDMSVGIRCLTEDRRDTAAELALQLDSINRSRRELEATMQAQALASVQSVQSTLGETLPVCLCLYEPDWHQGVVGLVAGRVKEQFHRPVFAFAKESDTRLKGSGRSIAGVHIRDLLAEVDRAAPALIDKFGGHAMAAGLSLPLAHLPAFRDALDVAMGQLFPHADFSPSLLTDGDLSCDYLTLDFAEQLRNVAPWGQQFPEPTFRGEATLVSSRVVGEKHLKMQVRLDDIVLDAIAFNQLAASLPDTGDCLRLAYRLDVNEWRQRRSVQLIVEQWQVID